MKHWVLGSLAYSSLIVVAAGCGAQESNGAATTANTEGDSADAQVTAAPVDAAGMTLLDASAGASPTAMASESEELDAALPSDADATQPTPTQGPTATSATPTGEPPLPPVAEPTTSVPDTTTPPTTPTTPPTTPTTPVQPEPSIDWSVLEAPEGCQVEVALSTDDDSCGLNLVCDGIYTSHSQCSLGSCYCQTDSSSLYVNVEGDDLVDICQASVDFCQPLRTDQVDELSCSFSSGTADMYYCSTGKVCVRSEEYESGVTATLESHESTECSFDPSSTAGQNGEWSCNCIREGFSYATFSAPGLAPTLDTCTQAQDLCLHFDDLVPAEGTMCEVTFETYNEDSCSSNSSCFIAATIEGVPVHYTGYLAISCAPGDEEQLSCTVDGPLGISNLTVTNPQPALGACRELAADVLRQMSPPITSPQVDAGVAEVIDGG